MNPTVAVIIVTFNRKDLLIQCLDAILTQTKLPNQIIIIDNASTDGTQAVLQEKNYLDNPLITYVPLLENTGGAGGFYTGMKAGYEAGYDWLWLMDDDGYPDKNCLENLLNMPSDFKIRGSTVLRLKEKQILRWTLIVYDSKCYFNPRKRLRNYEDLTCYSENLIYENYVLFFNAILVNKDVIKTIGLVNSELFIRGDEMEYFLRARSKKIKMGTKIDAFYYHPYQPINLNKAKYFYAFRNLFYNYCKYPTVTYPFFLRILYLSFMFIKYLLMTPSLSFKYNLIVLKAVFYAILGVLVPYS